MTNTIRIEMLGGLSVWADDVPVLENTTKINKPWQVFCFLVFNRAAPSTAARLLGALWPDEDLADPANVLKNTIYALRKEFGPPGKAPRNSPILFENGGYICNPAIHFEVDVELFEDKVKQAGAAQDMDEKLRLWGEGLQLYKGDLLPQLESEMWVMPLALYYRQLYTDTVKALCEGFYATEQYSDLLAVATTASRVDPLDENHYTYIFRALYAMEMYRSIIPAYNKTVRLFSEELGTMPNAEIRDIYAAASELVDSIEQDIMIIKEDLREVAGENGPVSGPLYCTYDVFKYLYQMVARSSERAGGSVVILLLTLLGKDGDIPPAKQLSSSMNQLKTLMLGGLLRKSDTVARYSKSQYIVMLTIDKAGNAEQVTERIRRRCEGFLDANGIDLVFATTELEPMH
ncbi:hypothetical protein LJC04_01670 [Ruminococcaceae bacterium OttesenSCG-928-O06]|nr:hypothetical protein [Ruminococcaceae bacterium OttesenSCG-928-O06]